MKVLDKLTDIILLPSRRPRESSQNPDRRQWDLPRFNRAQRKWLKPTGWGLRVEECRFNRPNRERQLWWRGTRAMRDSAWLKGPFKTHHSKGQRPPQRWTPTSGAASSAPLMKRTKRPLATTLSRLTERGIADPSLQSDTSVTTGLIQLIADTTSTCSMHTALKGPSR